MQLQVRKTSIDGIVEIFPRLFEDERGLFFESYNVHAFKACGLPTNFVQDNQSFSYKGVLRGLHFQLPPYSQGKLVRVIRGRVLDVAVDIRPGSSTFGKYELFELDDQRHNMVYVPEGFAHGFIALEDTVFSYKCTNVYHKASEAGIRWDDPYLAINWGATSPLVSEKDRVLPSFQEFFASQPDFFVS